MKNTLRKSKSTNAIASVMTRALLHYAADLGSRGMLDLVTLNATLRPRHRRQIRERRPDADYKPEDWLTPAQAAKVLKQSPKTLANKRSKGNGPPFTKISDRAIRYQYQDVIDFIKYGITMSTSERIPEKNLDVKEKLPKPLSAATVSSKVVASKPSEPRKSPKEKSRKRNKQGSRVKK